LVGLLWFTERINDKTMIDYTNLVDISCEKTEDVFHNFTIFINKTVALNTLATDEVFISGSYYEPPHKKILELLTNDLITNKGDMFRLSFRLIKKPS